MIRALADQVTPKPGEPGTEQPLSKFPGIGVQSSLTARGVIPAHLLAGSCAWSHRALLDLNRVAREGALHSAAPRSARGTFVVWICAAAEAAATGFEVVDGA